MHGVRIPADMIYLKTRDESGTFFIKIGQLDVVTDLKLRKSVLLLKCVPKFVK